MGHVPYTNLFKNGIFSWLDTAFGENTESTVAEYLSSTLILLYAILRDISTLHP